MAYLCSMPVLLTLEALCESAVPMIQLTLLELTLKEKPFINEQVNLLREDHIND